jgi:hypothetical protein
MAHHFEYALRRKTGIVNGDVRHMTGRKLQSKRPLITTARLLVAGVIAITILSIFPLRTPGECSDSHSQWLPGLVLAFIFTFLFVAVHWIYIQPKPWSKVQAIVLWLLFGGFVGFLMLPLIDSQEFLSEFNVPGPFDYVRHPSFFFRLPW